MSQGIGKWMITAGVLLIVVGIILYYGGNKLKWLGHLPGDIRIKGEGYRVYFPITTIILISILINVGIKLVKYLRDVLPF